MDLAHSSTKVLSSSVKASTMPYLSSIFLTSFLDSLKNDNGREVIPSANITQNSPFKQPPIAISPNTHRYSDMSKENSMLAESCSRHLNNFISSKVASLISTACHLRRYCYTPKWISPAPFQYHSAVILIRGINDYIN